MRDEPFIRKAMEPNHTFSPDWPDDEPLETFEALRDGVGTSDDEIYDAMTYLLARLAASECDTSRALSMLEAEGVPRERAKSVANGINVLATRYRKEVVVLEQALAAREREIESIAEAVDKLDDDGGEGYAKETLRTLLSPMCFP